MCNKTFGISTVHAHAHAHAHTHARTHARTHTHTHTHTHTNTASIGMTPSKGDMVRVQITAFR